MSTLTPVRLASVEYMIRPSRVKTLMRLMSPEATSLSSCASTSASGTAPRLRLPSVTIGST